MHLKASAGLDSLQECEFEFILATLEHFNGNRTKTADALKIGRRTLQRKILIMRSLGYVVPRHDQFDEGLLHLLEQDFGGNR